MKVIKAAVERMVSSTRAAVAIPTEGGTARRRWLPLELMQKTRRRKRSWTVQPLREEREDGGGASDVGRELLELRIDERRAADG